MVGMLLDTVVAVLLGATILFAIRLDRRLNALRQGRGEMQTLLIGIQDMTTRAEAGIAQFKAVTADGSAALQTQVRAADTLRGDLAMLIERAERMAERLQDATKPVRTSEGRGLAPSAADRAPAVARPALRRVGDEPVSRESPAPIEAAFVKALRRAR